MPWHTATPVSSVRQPKVNEAKNFLLCLKFMKHPQTKFHAHTMREPQVIKSKKSKFIIRVKVIVGSKFSCSSFFSLLIICWRKWLGNRPHGAVWIKWSVYHSSGVVQVYHANGCWFTSGFGALHFHNSDCFHVSICGTCFYLFFFKTFPTFALGVTITLELAYLGQLSRHLLQPPVASSTDVGETQTRYRSAATLNGLKEY